MGAAFFEAGRPLVQILSQLLALFDRLHDWPSSACHSKVNWFYCFFLELLSPADSKSLENQKKINLVSIDNSFPLN